MGSYLKRKMTLHGVYRGILNGIKERGEGGFLYVKGEECAYLFPHELKYQKEASEGLSDLLQGENAKSVFYVAVEKDGKMDILACPREEVWKEIGKEISSSRGGEDRVLNEEGEERLSSSSGKGDGRIYEEEEEGGGEEGSLPDTEKNGAGSGSDHTPPLQEEVPPV